MNQETKNCQNCKKDFTIEQEDFSFYEKIKVPPPTWCPECRMKRRMLHRNESVWYKRKCDATGEEMISMFAPEKPFTVYSQEYWKSDKWDPLSYGREYDFSRTFFEQFAELMKEVPFPNLIQKNVVNSKYTNYTLNQKNTYFVGGADMAEDCAYMFGSNIRVKDCFDTYRVGDLELCYGVVDCEKSSRLFFAQDCVGCANSALLYDCRNCVDCFGCVGLRNKQYYVFNQPYSKEEYKKKVDSLNINTASGLAEAQAEFEKRKLRTPRKFAWIVNSENVSGNDIVHAHNCHYCFSARNNVENCKYSYRILDCKDSYDVFVGWNGAELLYEVFSVSAQRVIGSALIWGGFDIRHSYNCFDCSNIFGCVGLRNKQYCVFNKQYSKEEYEKLAPRIIEQMSALPYTDAKGRIYGYSEFFPPELSLFAYNESVAQAYFPKTKDAVLKEGGFWRDQDRKAYNITQATEDLPDDIDEVPDSFIGEVIECAHRGECNDGCSTAFRVIALELQFLKKFRLPLPRLCPVCRKQERINLRNTLKLWARKCQCAGTHSSNTVYTNTATHTHGDTPCPTEFETSYAPDRPEIVYCESCYNAEVA